MLPLPYFKIGNHIYYVTYQDAKEIDLLAYNLETQRYTALNRRTIKNNKVTVIYRPNRIKKNLNELEEFEL